MCECRAPTTLGTIVNDSKPSDFRPIRVQEAWDETPTLRGIRFESDQTFAELHRHPGQVVRVRTADAQAAYFALATGPAPERAAELLVRRGNAISDAIVAAARPGAWLETTHPEGPGFPIQEARGRNVLLFATGSGITPIRALIQHLIERRAEVGRVRLFYGQRFETDFAYRGDHAEWERAGVQVSLCCSRPSAEWRGLHGHVQDTLRDSDPSGTLAGTVTFLSGLPEMIADVGQLLLARGLPPGRLHLNY
jgi:sulfhydrogenase subunit gamma (sulfur reductase)